MSNLRRRLEEEVNRIGISKIATQLGIARNTVYNWLAKGNIPLNMLVALGELGADTAFIVTGQRLGTTLAGDEGVDTAPTLTPREVALLDNYRHSGEEGKRAVEVAAAALAKPKAVGD